MNDEEFDEALAERFKAYESRVRLPDEFKRRFVGSVRRKRILRRAGTLCFVCIAAAICIALSCATRSDAGRCDSRLALMAASPTTNETAEVSYLMLLGYLRECFTRSKSPRRKEEE